MQVTAGKRFGTANALTIRLSLQHAWCGYSQEGWKRLRIHSSESSVTSNSRPGKVHQRLERTVDAILMIELEVLESAFGRKIDVLVLELKDILALLQR